MSILEGPLTSVAFCWRIERSDGAGLAFTSSDRAIDRGGIAHSSAPGVTPAALSRSLGLQPDNTEVSGAVTIDALSEADLALGRWNGAAVELTAVDWADADAEGFLLLRGELGEVSINGHAFSAELQGAAARLTALPCPSTSPECRAILGDKDCRVDMAARRIRCTVATASDNWIELEQTVADRFACGRLRFLDGANCGLVATIVGVNGGTLFLRERPTALVASGARVELQEGCDKRFATCASRFANAANFRGEPHVPGMDLLTRYPGA